MTALQGLNIVHTDEVGNRVAGFTVQTAEGSRCVPTLEAVAALGEGVWASEADLRVWISREPAYWGEHAISATFRVADHLGRQVREVEVIRAEVEAPVSRFSDD